MARLCRLLWLVVGKVSRLRIRSKMLNFANRRPEPSKMEDRERKQRLDSLLLSKSRLLQQLERAKHPAHRSVLLNGLKAIEKEIEET